MVGAIVDIGDKKNYAEEENSIFCQPLESRRID